MTVEYNNPSTNLQTLEPDARPLYERLRSAERTNDAASHIRAAADPVITASPEFAVLG